MKAYKEVYREVEGLSAVSVLVTKACVLLETSIYQAKNWQLSVDSAFSSSSIGEGRNTLSCAQLANVFTSNREEWDILHIRKWQDTVTPDFSP